MSEHQMTCEICDFEWGCRSYYDTVCPKCGQTYIYDEAITIKLLPWQVELLKSKVDKS